MYQVDICPKYRLYGTKMDESLYFSLERMRQAEMF